jgi:cyclophilin family peptidyl-prolyl cis-trans isomerase
MRSRRVIITAWWGALGASLAACGPPSAPSTPISMSESWLFTAPPPADMFGFIGPPRPAQGGDPNTVDKPPNTWGTGGPGYMFGLEIVPALNFDSRGILGMARTMDPNSNGSQFFITLAAATNLDGMYTVFGKVVEGDAVLDMIKRGMGATFTDPTRMQIVRICQK